MSAVDGLPRRLETEAKELLRKIPYAQTRAETERLRGRFTHRFGKAQPQAVETLLRDWNRMVTFCRFPKEHWKHLRTTTGERHKHVANATARSFGDASPSRRRSHRSRGNPCQRGRIEGRRVNSFTRLLT